MFSWVLSLLPESIFILIYYIMLSAGIVLYIASKLVTWIPMMGQYRLPAEVVGVVLLVVGAFFYGGHGVQKAWLERVAELEAKVKAAESKSQIVNTVIQTKIVERVKIVEKQVEVVKKEIEIQREVINAECKINDIAVELYNKAISDPIEMNK
jgi:hypothetical protein